MLSIARTTGAARCRAGEAARRTTSVFAMLARSRRLNLVKYAPSMNTGVADTTICPGRCGDRHLLRPIDALWGGKEPSCSLNGRATRWQ